MLTAAPSDPQLISQSAPGLSGVLGTDTSGLAAAEDGHGTGVQLAAVAAEVQPIVQISTVSGGLYLPPPPPPVRSLEDMEAEQAEKAKKGAQHTMTALNGPRTEYSH